MAEFILVSKVYSLDSTCFLPTTLPTTLTLLPITSSKHGLHSFVPVTMTVHR